MRDVIIWGCPRSGTSITLELFKMHGGYRHWFEPGLWVFGDDTPLWKHAVKNPVTIDNTPGLSANLEKVRAIFPEALHIWIQRNPFDTVCSLKPGMEEQPHPPELPEAVKSRPLVDRCAYLWNMWNTDGKRAVEDALVPTAYVDYEYMLLEPRLVARELLDMAHAYDLAVVDGWAARVSQRSGEFEAAWQTRWTTPHELHYGRWRAELTEAEIVAIENITGIPRTDAP